MRADDFQALMSYHNGYILALEDLQRDIERFNRSGIATRERILSQIRSSRREAIQSQKAIAATYATEAGSD